MIYRTWRMTLVHQDGKIQTWMFGGPINSGCCRMWFGEVGWWWLYFVHNWIWDTRKTLRDSQQTFGNVAPSLWEFGVRNVSSKAIMIAVSLRLWKWLRLQWNSKTQAKNGIVEILTFWNWEKQKTRVASKVQCHSAERKRKGQKGANMVQSCREDEFHPMSLDSVMGGNWWLKEEISA